MATRVDSGFSVTPKMNAGAVFVTTIVFNLFFVAGVSAQNPDKTKPHWEYVRTESGVFPYDAQGCYQPSVHRAEEGLVEITVNKCKHPDDKTKVSTRLRFEWTRPPQYLYPGQPFDYTLTTTMISNTDPDWFIAGTIWVRPEIGDNILPFPGWAGGTEAYIGKGSPMSVIVSNLNRDQSQQERVPGGWINEDKNKPVVLRVNFVASHSNKHWWSYIYHYTDPSQKKTKKTQTGYQLYFDGQLVSGPDAKNYTREQAEENCNWNKVHNADKDIRCVYNGTVIGEWKKNQDTHDEKPVLKGTWSVTETNTSTGQYWKATWRLQEDGRSFDGHWKVFPGGEEGDLPNFARIKSIRKNQIVIDRPGVGIYQATISDDRRSVKGTLTWCSECVWEAVFDQPLPQEMN